MRVVVFGYHNIGHVCLQELLRQGHEVAAVVTHEDDPSEEIWFASVPQLARSSGLPTYTPTNPNTPEFVNLIGGLQPELLFSFYYRHLLKAPLLGLPSRGCLNLHGSYLPQYRGRCPVNWVLVNGESYTGVTLHHMVEQPDAGDIVAQRKVPIAFEDTAATLYVKMTAAAGEMFAEVLPQLAAGTAPRVLQNQSQASYYGGRKPADGEFHWDWPGLRTYNLVRAVTHPYPGAYTSFGGRRLLVWECVPIENELLATPPGSVVAVNVEGIVVATGENQLLLQSVQLEGEAQMSGTEFARLHDLRVGETMSARA
ncbi:MAG: formyltransferase [Armatimonadota bacterium]